METPLNPLVAEMVAKLNSALREDFEERAAIIGMEEFEGDGNADYSLKFKRKLNSKELSD